MKKFIFSLLLGVSSLFALVDINSASKEELMSAKGIGAKTAEAIMEARAKKCFNNVDELTVIKGIGTKKVEKLKEFFEAKPCKK